MVLVPTYYLKIKTLNNWSSGNKFLETVIYNHVFKNNQNFGIYLWTLRNINVLCEHQRNSTKKFSGIDQWM